MGIAVASIGYLGYAMASAGWMALAWLTVWLLGALVMPSTNALMSKRIGKDAQGELQGAVACLYSLSSIVGPPLMSQLFGRFSSPGAPVYLPGAAFVAAAALSLGSLAVYWRSTREAVGPADEPVLLSS
jgi:MFS transporter, DHA1 family, tetracycline resistance protein